MGRYAPLIIAPVEGSSLKCLIYNQFERYFVIQNYCLHVCLVQAQAFPSEQFTLQGFEIIKHLFKAAKSGWNKGYDQTLLTRWIWPQVGLSGAGLLLTSFF